MISLSRTKDKYLEETVRNEDRSVVSFIKNNFSNNNCSYLEVGSGLGGFPVVARDRFPNLKITCLEINPNLAKETKRKGFRTICGSALGVKLPSEIFDIVHCSHLIEHLRYPDVARALDEMLRLLKVGGFLIIRSPLMHPGFYIDIDHVRPYPPQSIINYLNIEQQQRKSQYRAREVWRWFRREAYQVNRFTGLEPVRLLNSLLLKSWTKYHWPTSDPNGFILILQKTQR